MPKHLGLLPPSRFAVFSTLLLLLAPLARAATERVVTVKSSGGNYTTLAAAIAGEAKNLVSLDRQLTIECYSSAAPDRSQVSISSGWVTDSTRYLRIVVPPSERHSGKFDATKYHRIMNNYQQGIVISGVPYTRIEGVQFYVSEANYSPSYPIQLSSCRNCLVDSVIVNAWYGFQSPRHGIHITLSGGSVVRNSVIYGVAEAAIGVNWEPVTIDNVTMVNRGLYNNALYGIDWSLNGGTGHVIRNTYCGGFANNCYHGPTAAVAMTTSASSDLTGNIDNVSVASASFVDDTGPTIDLHLQAASPLKDVGTSLSTVFTLDIDGQPRSGAWDIGADEADGGAPPPPPPPGPTPNEKFIQSFFQDFLSRQPTSSELQTLAGQLDSGSSRSSVVQSVCSTSEGAGKIANMIQTMVVNPLFQSYLKRLPTSGEVSSLGTPMNSSFTQILVTIFASDEYYQAAINK